MTGSEVLSLRPAICCDPERMFELCYNLFNSKKVVGSVLKIVVAWIRAGIGAMCEKSSSGDVEKRNADGIHSRSNSFGKIWNWEDEGKCCSESRIHAQISKFECQIHIEIQILKKPDTR